MGQVSQTFERDNVLISIPSGVFNFMYSLIVDFFHFEFSFGRMGKGASGTDGGGAGGEGGPEDASAELEGGEGGRAARPVEGPRQRQGPVEHSRVGGGGVARQICGVPEHRGNIFTIQTREEEGLQSLPPMQYHVGQVKRTRQGWGSVPGTWIGISVTRNSLQVHTS